MKVLLSAYACEPNRGSEPGVGWNWAIEIAKRGHEVIVFTRQNNKASIQTVESIPQNLQFEYYDLPVQLMWSKKLFGVHVYYLLWQVGLFFKVKSYLKQNDIDIIHHITFVAIRKYSFLCFLNKPFFYGPLGGGESCPTYLLKNSGFKNRLKEQVRNVLNWSLKFNLLAFIIFKKSKKIFVTTSDSKKYIPKQFHPKTSIAPAIGIESFEKTEFKPLLDNEKLNLIYAGNFIYLKGIQIAFDALKELKKKGVPLKLTLVGKGPFKSKLEDIAIENDISQDLNWIDWLPREELQKVYRSSDAFLFPSLHDSGGMVVLESLQQGVPVICFNLGGPDLFVNDTVGYKINVVDSSYVQVIESLTKVFETIHQDRSILRGKSAKCKEWVKQFKWDNTVDKVYCQIESDVKKIS